MTSPSSPARTSEGRQIRARNSVRRSGAPTSLAKIGSSLANVWVPESRRTSCDLLILVEEPAEAVVSFDLVDLSCCAAGEWS